VGVGVRVRERVYKEGLHVCVCVCVVWILEKKYYKHTIYIRKETQRC